MDLRLIRGRRAWKILRSMPRWQLVACCAAVQVGGLFAMILLFVARPIVEIESERERRVAGGLIAEAWHKQREKMHSLRAELARYETVLDSNVLSVTPAEEDGHMNFLFKELTHLSSESGISIRAFQRAGQGLNFDGFAQASFDTNFLQMITFMSALSEASVPIHVMEFSVHQANDSPDKISFSLTISVAAHQAPQASTCFR